MMTSEMPELLGLSDRIAVMCEGPPHRHHVARRGDAGEDPQCGDRLTAQGHGGISGAPAHDERIHRRSTAADRSRRCSPASSRRQELALLICLLLVIAFFSFTAENFFSVRNMTNVLGQASLALIAGIGCAIVFISGEVDISIGSLLAAIALPLIVIMNETESWRSASPRAAVRPDHRRGERLPDRLCRHQFADRHAGHDVHHARRRLSLHRPAGDPRRHHARQLHRLSDGRLFNIDSRTRQ